jgi:antibiotic biosynthesis monooxygenase (ABM) superfamily enzyme
LVEKLVILGKYDRFFNQKRRVGFKQCFIGRWGMAVTVLIRRKVTSDTGELLENIYRELVAVAVKQKGYLSAESMRRVDVPDEHLVICKWEHIDDWAKWLISGARMELQDRIDALINSKTRFEIYE